jgi:hypothetical protein
LIASATNTKSHHQTTSDYLVWWTTPASAPNLVALPAAGELKKKKQEGNISAGKRNYMNRGAAVPCARGRSLIINSDIISTRQQVFIL